MFNGIVAEFEDRGLLRVGAISPLDEPSSGHSPSAQHLSQGLYQTPRSSNLQDRFTPILSKLLDEHPPYTVQREVELKEFLIALREFTKSLDPSDYKRLLTEPGSMYRSLLDAVKDPMWQEQISEEYKSCNATISAAGELLVWEISEPLLYNGLRHPRARRSHSTRAERFLPRAANDFFSTGTAGSDKILSRKAI